MRAKGYDGGMINAVHRLSGLFFYGLGISFFAVYLLLANDLLTEWAVWWLQVADLPLILCTLLFGGTGFIRSLRRPGARAPLLSSFVFIVLTGVFLFLVTLNFWDVLPVSVTNILIQN